MNFLYASVILEKYHLELLIISLMILDYNTSIHIFLYNNVGISCIFIAYKEKCLSNSFQMCRIKKRGQWITKRSSGLKFYEQEINLFSNLSYGWN